MVFSKHLHFVSSGISFTVKFDFMKFGFIPVKLLKISATAFNKLTIHSS